MSRETTLTREQITAAERLWNEEGMPARVIAKRLGMSHNQVIGHAHRRGWAKRPSPLGRPLPRVRENA